MGRGTQGSARVRPSVVRYRGYVLWHDAAAGGWCVESSEGLDDADAGVWGSYRALLAAIDESHRAPGEEVGALGIPSVERPGRSG